MRGQRRSHQNKPGRFEVSNRKKCFWGNWYYVLGKDEEIFDPYGVQIIGSPSLVPTITALTCILRSDPSTWTDSNWPGDFRSGITCTFGACQQPSLWFLRGHPGVQKVFATIWSVKPSQLITSMDAILLWRHRAQQTQGTSFHDFNFF